MQALDPESPIHNKYKEHLPLFSDLLNSRYNPLLHQYSHHTMEQYVAAVHFPPLAACRGTVSSRAAWALDCNTGVCGMDGWRGVLGKAERRGAKGWGLIGLKQRGGGIDGRRGVGGKG
jgi:hypothetical protein